MDGIANFPQSSWEESRHAYVRTCLRTNVCVCACNWCVLTSVCDVFLCVVPSV